MNVDVVSGLAPDPDLLIRSAISRAEPVLEETTLA